MKSLIKNKRVAISSFRTKQFNGEIINEMILIRNILSLYMFVNYIITIIETTCCFIYFDNSDAQRL